MICTIAIQGYRSLRELVLPLGQFTVVTGANGSGKSSVYRSLRLLADAAKNAVIASLAREGGLSSTFLGRTGNPDVVVPHGTPCARLVGDAAPPASFHLNVAKDRF